MFLGLSSSAGISVSQKNSNAGLLDLDPGLEPEFYEEALFSSTQLSDMVHLSPGSNSRLSASSSS